MFQIRMLQVFSCLLWLCLIFGLFIGLRNHVYIPAIIGISVNFMWQYGTRIAIRQRKQRLALHHER
jgi:hypothetical protein